MKEQGDVVLVDALRRWAEASGLGQTELAARTGVAQSTLSRLFAGKSQRLRAETAECLRRHVPERFRREAAGPELPTDAVRSAAGSRSSVFVSSTYLDNARRRAWVREAVERAGMTPIGMERWSASAAGARELSVHRVREADVFVGVLAWRYGWIPAGEEKSIVELEYEEALRRGIPRLMFWIDEPLAKVNVAVEFDPDDRWRKQALLDAFKERAKREQTAVPFTDEKLQVLVLQALMEWERRQTHAALAPPEILSAAASQSHEAELASYLQRVEAECSAVSFLGFGGSLRVEPPLEDLYVELDLSPLAREEEAARPEQAWKDGEVRAEGGALTLLDALQKVSREQALRGLVILGHPGAGKTTLLRRLALALAREGATELGLQPPDLVPVFLPLRELEASERSITEFAERRLADEDEGLDAELASWIWKRGRLAILVDGLDEVPQQRRGKIKESIEKLASRPGHESLVVVTCRHAGYLGPARFGASFLPVELRTLSRERSEGFIEKWYRAVETDAASRHGTARELAAAERKAREAAGELIQRLREMQHSTRIQELARNPMMLTAVCLVHRDRKKLPERAAELYENAVQVLLHLWREQKLLPLGFDPRLARRVLQALALWLHEEEGRTHAAEDDVEDFLRPVLEELGARELSPRAFLATVRDESGLFTGWSGERYGFLHLAFQEHLAACELHRRLSKAAPDPPRFQAEIEALAARFGSSWWSEVLTLFCAIDDTALSAHLFRALLRRPDFAEHADLAHQCAASSLAFPPEPLRELLRLPWEQGLWPNREIAADLLQSTAAEGVTPADLQPALELIDRVAESGVPVEDREAAWSLASRYAPSELKRRAGGARITWIGGEAWGTAPSLPGAPGSSPTVAVPPDELTEPRSGVELVHIPAGRFLMGSPENEKGRWDDEGPQHEVELGPFYLARHPVTNEQYARFLADNPAVDPPARWADRRYNEPRQPVVGVSWGDAQLFCEWAGLALPTEAQWEYACRAGTTTRYWSGDTEADLARVGWYDKNSGGRLHPVCEKTPNPFGLFDMHGNIWEWCEDHWSKDYDVSSIWHPRPYRAIDGEHHVDRGGSYAASAASARSACRGEWLAQYRARSLGFRPAKGITP